MVAELKIGVVKSEVLTGLCLCALIMLFATVEPSTHVVLESQWKKVAISISEKNERERLLVFMTSSLGKKREGFKFEKGNKLEHQDEMIFAGEKVKILDTMIYGGKQQRSLQQHSYELYEFFFKYPDQLLVAQVSDAVFFSQLCALLFLNMYHSWRSLTR